MIKWCKHCGLEFTTAKNNKRIFCSRGCGQKYWVNANPEKVKLKSRKYYLLHHKKNPLHKILCAGCNIPLFRTGPSHKFCDNCRKQRDVLSRRRWEDKNDKKNYDRKYYLTHKDKFKYKPKPKKFFTCQCGKVLDKKPNQKYCPECRKKRAVEMATRWARNNTDKKKAAIDKRKASGLYVKRTRTQEESKANYQKHKLKIAERDFKKRIMLDDSYVKKSLIHFGITSKYVTKEQIEEKRLALKVQRAIKLLNKKNNAS